MKKYYVVWKGWKVGIFKTWSECEKNIKKYPGARYKKFSTIDKAKKAFSESHTKYWGVKKKKKFKKKKNTAFSLPQGSNVSYFLKNSIVVDGACSYKGNTGDIEYQGLDLATGEYIFQSKVYQGGTNNISEFLALYEAVVYSENNNYKGVIFSDSLIAISWIHRKVCNTNLKHLKNPELIKYINKALDYLKSHETYPKIHKWETDQWGENPADYGRK